MRAKQNTRGSSSDWLRDHVRTPSRDRIDPADCGSELGFRLVHDDATGVVHGSAWNVTADEGSAAYSFRLLPGFYNSNLGLRLVREVE